YERTPLGRAASLGFHESQSRLWENVIGRSRPFCQWLLPRLRHRFPGRLEAVDAEGLYRAVNRVRPSLIRVDADEVTYNLHILLRFDLERRLVRGELAVADLPLAWRAGMEELLGIAPTTDAEGVLQDVHWSGGSFGYFPTYTLGTLLAAQLWEAIQRDCPDVEERMAGGDFGPVLSWLRQRIHAHGGKYLPAELVRLATGRELSPEPFLAYVRTKYSDLYGLCGPSALT
ncbi:MAG: carboxypeptidase M32, partial [Clostridia bacterium]|nr:carboxypeptidase M32 [Clostridia bacterium]